MSDRSDRIDLRPWAAPPAPGGLADRVMATIAGELGDTDDVAAGRDAIATAREPLARRRGWPRYLAVAAGSAAIAAASTWWLAGARPRRPGDVAITPTAGTVAVTSSGDARVRITTPLAVIETGPGPARLELSPLSPDRMEHDVNRNRALALGGGAALLAGGLAILVHEGQATVGRPGLPAAIVTDGQTLTLEPSPAAPPGPRLVAHATRDRALREQVATAITAARARRAASRPAAAGTALDGGLTTVGADTSEDAPLPLAKDAIRTGVREVIPMLADCYQQELLDKGVHAEGTVTAHLIVETDPTAGTVVSIDEQQSLGFEMSVGARPVAGGGLATPPETSAAMRSFGQCLELTLESVVLPPMNGGDRLAITYPFVFAEDEDDDDDGGGAGSSPRAPAAPPR